MPNSRSRSPPPGRERRQRSRSPRRRRDDDRPRREGGGFRWKEKRRDDDDRDAGDERRLERGYRDRSRERPKSPVPERKDKIAAPEIAEKPVKPKKEKKEKSESRAPAPAPTGEPMIIVNVNDRLGTKASIPCLASDPISKSCWLSLMSIRN